MSRIDRRELNSRAGASITELMVSLIVVAAALAALAQMVGFSAQQRRGSEARRLAALELANQAERIAALAWDETVPGKLTDWQPSAEFAAAVQSPVCRAVVTDEAGPPTSRRIRLEVEWTLTGGDTVAPLSLTVWKFAEGGAE